jgi:GrpB-like predicted nucleotidyltransferase (UPF0157 family)
MPVVWHNRVGLPRSTGTMKNDDHVPIDPVLIQDYDAAWPDTFSKLATAVKAALSSLVVTVEHIGSTAVPGLAAKPVIDLDVVLASPADFPEAIRLLATIGYLHEGDLGVAGREAFRSPAGEPRHHLYVLAAGAEELGRHIAFRSALRASEDLRDKYAALKRSLAKAYKEDRGAYAEAKTNFITSIVGTRDQMLQPRDAVEPMRARLSADLLAAMKERDKPTIDTLRCLLAVLDNAGAQDAKAFGSSTEVPRKTLTHNELQALMQAELTSRRTAVIEYERGGRHQDAARLREELILLSRYIAL